MKLILDNWQKEVLECKGNICLRSGRQVGKSTIISQKAAQFALNHPNTTTMVIASVERQAQHLFFMILNYLEENAKGKLARKPTLTFIELKNGAIIRCLPTGDSGFGIRGYTVNLLIADEAAFIPETVWSAITPMLAVTKGNIILLSTPFGRNNYFARCFNDDSYTKFHVSAEDCPRKNQEFLDHEKKTMTKLQYSQEYLGEFVDELMQFFPDKLIIKSQILQRKKVIIPNRTYFLGVDIARMGGDESTFEIIDRTDRDNLIHVENIITTKTLTTETTRKIIELEKQYHFKKIYIDDGGMGVGVFDSLLETDDIRRKIIPINNAQRSLDKEDKRKKKLIKEDLYNNLLKLMERGEIKLLDDPEIFQSLKSVQYEYTEKGELKIFGRYTHIAEGLIRAAWSSRDKSLNLYIY